MGQYDFQQICLKGHQITDRYLSLPEHRKDFCPDCGEKTLTKCPNCDALIKGDYKVEGVTVLSTFTSPVPSHCESCGLPFPWAKSTFKKSFRLKRKIFRAKKKISIWGLDFNLPIWIIALFVLTGIISTIIFNWPSVKDFLLDIRKWNGAKQNSGTEISIKRQEKQRPLHDEFSYSFTDLENKGYVHKPPVVNSPRYCNNDCNVAAQEICIRLGHNLLISYEVRDEGRAIQSVVCK